MKKITIILGFLSLFIYIQPISAYDKYGGDDDPINMGAGCDDVIIWGDAPDPDPLWFDTGNWPPAEPPYINPDEWEQWYDNYWGGNSGGNGNNNNGNKIHSAQNHLSPQAQAVLEQKLREMLAYCAYQEMYDHLLGAGAMFNDIAIDPSIPGGGYNPCQDKLLFGNEGYINGSFPEEFIHFFQDHYYPGGICIHFGSDQHYNIEFEAKLMQDIINHYGMEQGYNMGTIYYGEGQSLSNIYVKWMDYLTNDGTSMPSQAQIFQSFQSYTYWDFMNDWAIKNGVSVDPNFGSNIFSILDGCW